MAQVHTRQFKWSPLRHKREVSTKGYIALPWLRHSAWVSNPVAFALIHTGWTMEQLGVAVGLERHKAKDSIRRWSMSPQITPYGVVVQLIHILSNMEIDPDGEYPHALRSKEPSPGEGQGQPEKGQGGAEDSRGPDPDRECPTPTPEPSHG